MSNFSKVALITNDEHLSHKELEELSSRLVAPLHGRALVIMLVKNDVPSIAFYVGCLSNSIVPLMVNADISQDLLKQLINIYVPEFIWGEKALVDELSGNADVLIENRGYVLAQLNSESPCLYPELALLLSTSGSTGSPKLVRQSYQNIKANTASIIEYLDIIDTDKAITTLPFGYTYGISIINSHLAAGAAVILNELSLMDRGFWNLLKNEEATTFGGVPYTYQMLYRLRFERMDLPSLRYITQAGGRLGEELHRKFGETCRDKGIDFVVMYGQTEATARMSYLPASKTLEKVGSIGIAIPGGSFTLMDVDGRKIEEREVSGELIYEGKNVTLGYALNASDLAKGDERQGVLQTGDVAYFDKDGFFYITGRLKRFLKVYGNRVGLDELESILQKAGILAAVAGIDDHVRIFVEEGEPDEAVRIIVEATGINRAAFKAEKIDAIPRNSSGKVQYSELELLI